MRLGWGGYIVRLLMLKKSKNCPKAEAKVWSFREKNKNFQLNKAKTEKEMKRGAPLTSAPRSGNITAYPFVNAPLRA